MFDEPRLQYSNSDYTHLNYAVLHGSGIAHAFNFMRYNHAFLARRSDFEHLRESALDYGNWITRRYAILLCRYDWKGPTRANWQHGMLLSDQELHEVSNPSELYELNADQTVLRPPKKLKVQHVCTISGPIDYLLEIMYVNQACPYEEVDARVLEQAMWTQMNEPNRYITVNLANYRAIKTMWTMPPKVALCDHIRASAEGYEKCPLCGESLK